MKVKCCAVLGFMVTCVCIFPDNYRRSNVIVYCIHPDGVDLRDAGVLDLGAIGELAELRLVVVCREKLVPQVIVMW